LPRPGIEAQSPSSQPVVMAMSCNDPLYIEDIVLECRSAEKREIQVKFPVYMGNILQPSNWPIY